MHCRCFFSAELYSKHSLYGGALFIVYECVMFTVQTASVLCASFPKKFLRLKNARRACSLIPFSILLFFLKRNGTFILYCLHIALFVCVCLFAVAHILDDCVFNISTFRCHLLIWAFFQSSFFTLQKMESSKGAEKKIQWHYKNWIKQKTK